MNVTKNRTLVGNAFNITGIIGKSGKSTIAHMIHHCYLGLGIESETGTVTEILKKINDKSYEKKAKDVIMEVYQCDIKEKKVSYIDLDTLIFTNSGKDAEINESWTMKRPFIALPIDKIAIINIDDDQGLDFCNMTVAKTVTYGFNESADIQACYIKLAIDKTQFDLHYKGNFVCHIEIPYFGFYNVYNILATIAYFVSKGYEPVNISQLLSKLPQLTGRFDTFSTESQIRVIVDYARTPEATKSILTSLMAVCGGHVITVVGADGNTPRKTRELLGKNVLSYSKQAIITSDNPRTEEPQSIVYDMIKGSARQNYRLCIDREKAIEIALKMAKPKDVVVILGKGHETKQIVKDKVSFFCDKTTAKYFIRKLDI
ncbi:MAG: Mur ligase family protein [Defluviitaleaceae bacterium]|nr:Mur ligase family protein [Defluviitaleaceae bacterium]